MKKLAFTGALLICLSCANGQRSVDRLFEKYSDSDDFTCITVNGNLLNIEASLDDDDDDGGKDIKAKITGVRILAQKDHHSDAGNFHDIVIKDLDLHGYDEFMRVKESDQDLRVLVRSQGRRITEFLLVTGGNDNAIIQVKGNMSVSDARRLCENARKNHGSDIF
ncbi:MAG: DUF4252 domain-containing protein [Chloroflexota bacterium]